MSELQNKVILVTGASRGIGRAVASVCAGRGATVVATSIEKELTDELVQGFPAHKKAHSSFQMDVSKPQEVREVFEVVAEEYGRLDGLVNNAGLDFSKPFLQTSREEWNKIMDVNFNSLFDTCQAAINLFLRRSQGGAIVNVSSVHTHATYEGSGVYAATKAGMKMLTKSLTCEYAKEGIRINAVAPGVTRTDIWKAHVEKHGSEEKALAHWSKNIPAGRIVEPEEVGELCSFLLSDRATSINGSLIYIDGGLTSQLIASE